MRRPLSLAITKSYVKVCALQDQQGPQKPEDSLQCTITEHLLIGSPIRYSGSQGSQKQDLRQSAGNPQSKQWFPNVSPGSIFWLMYQLHLWNIRCAYMLHNIISIVTWFLRAGHKVSVLGLGSQSHHNKPSDRVLKNSIETTFMKQL